VPRRQEAPTNPAQTDEVSAGAGAERSAAGLGERLNRLVLVGPVVAVHAPAAVARVHHALPSHELGDEAAETAAREARAQAAHERYTEHVVHHLEAPVETALAHLGDEAAGLRAEAHEVGHYATDMRHEGGGPL